MESTRRATGDDNEHEGKEWRSTFGRGVDGRGREVWLQNEKTDVGGSESEIKEEGVEKIPCLQKAPDRQDRGQTCVAQEDPGPLRLCRPALRGHSDRRVKGAQPDEEQNEHEAYRACRRQREVLLVEKKAHDHGHGYESGRG